MEAKIRDLVSAWITQNKPAMVPPGGLAHDYDLLQAGVIDSLDYLNIVEHVGAELGIEIDIGKFDDSQLATIAGMSHQISKQA
jgi:acyl carrier protein